MSAADAAACASHVTEFYAPYCCLAILLLLLLLPLLPAGLC
jgi:hypothetical protein